MKHRDILNKYFCKDKIQIPTILLVQKKKIANFHFSHYVYGNHSNQSSYPTGIKNTNYVEATVRNMYTKYRIHPLDSSLRKLAHAIYRFFSTVKIKNFIRKFLIFLLFLLQNIDCGYTLEPPRRGGSNEIYVLEQK